MATLVITDYQYPASSFPSGYTIQGLKLAIPLVSDITTNLCNVFEVTVDSVLNVDFQFDDVLSASAKTALDNLVSSYSGFYTRYEVLATSTFIPGTIPVTATTIGSLNYGVVSTPSFFNPDLDNLVGRVSGAYYTSDASTTLTLRLVETAVLDQTQNILTTPDLVLPATSGNPARINFWTNIPPRSGTNIYDLWAQITGAGNVTLQYISMTLIYKNFI